MKKNNKKFIKYSLITILVLVFVIAFIGYLNNKFSSAKQAQEQSDQANSDKEKELRKQELLSQKESLDKNIQAKKTEGDSYKKLSDTYCGYLNSPSPMYRSYIEQCEIYRSKAIDAYTQARTLAIEYESVTQKINTGNY